MTLYLQHLREKLEREGAEDQDGMGEEPDLDRLCGDSESSNIIGNVLIHPTAKVHPEALIGPNVTIGEKCVVQKGARIQDSCLLAFSQIKQDAFIRQSIIGWKSIVGRWVRIEGVSVLAEDVQIRDELFINGSFILPHKNIANSIPNAGTIVM